MKILPLLALSSLCFLESVVAQTPGDLVIPADLDVGALKTENGAHVAVEDEAGAKVLKISFPGGGGYPGVDFASPVGGWDLAAFGGIAANVTNAGTTNLGVTLRVENAGDWRQSPWNSNVVWLKPGAGGTITVNFGESFGKPGFPLNAAAVSKLKIFATEPKQEGAILVHDIKAVGASSRAQTTPSQAGKTAAASPKSAPASPANAGVSLIDFASLDVASLKTENSAEVAVVEDGGTKALQLNFPASQGYPGVDFEEGGPWDLSAAAGVEVAVENKGSGKVGFNVRVDNPGDWKKSPWNTETIWLEPGAVKTATVTFGQSFGRAGYPLDASRVSRVKIFANPSATAGSLVIRSIQPFGTAGERAVATAAEAAPASGGLLPPAPDNPNAPSIGGELFPLDGEPNLSKLQTQNVKVSLDSSSGAPAIKAEFSPDNYPNLKFPCAGLGWNLQAFSGVQIELTNTGPVKVRAALRVDNPGDWKLEPWNTEMSYVEPGETKVLKLVFGKDSGAPGFDLDPTQVTGIQLFLERPKQPTTLLIRDLKAFGSGSERVSNTALTKPADRTVPATPPDWLGQRPPVPGDWVQTLDENFEGDSLNTKLWTPRFPWDGPQPGQLQRYAPENVTVKNGRLVIKAEKLAGHENNDSSLGRREYTSGLVQSFDKWTQRYGYFEARVKLPTARGLWPAFWMMPDRGRDSGLDTWKRRDTGNGAMEIDILEHLCEWGPGRNNVAVHWDGYGSDHKQWGSTHVYFGPTPDGWHNFGLLWEPGKLTWFIDGKKVIEWENERVSDVASYLKLNIQMGGWAAKDVDLSKLPDVMEVEFVRAWQLKDRLEKNAAAKP